VSCAACWLTGLLPGEAAYTACTAAGACAAALHQAHSAGASMHSLLTCIAFSCWCVHCQRQRRHASGLRIAAAMTAECMAVPTACCLRFMLVGTIKQQPSRPAQGCRRCASGTCLPVLPFHGVVSRHSPAPAGKQAEMPRVSIVPRSLYGVIFACYQQRVPRYCVRSPWQLR
jgi:hypothetical protein